MAAFVWLTIPEVQERIMEAQQQVAGRQAAGEGI